MAHVFCYTGCNGRTNGTAIQGIMIANSAVHDDHEGTYESPYTQYDTVSSDEAPPRHKQTLAEFDNPLYSDTGPVSFSETTLYESVSLLYYQLSVNIVFPMDCICC